MGQEQQINSFLQLKKYKGDNLPLGVDINGNILLLPPSAETSVGVYSTTDTGQAEILIPHGLGAIPVSWNIKGKNLAGKNVVNVSNETADSTNIILTPEFMNNDGQSLNFLWQAFL